MSPLCSPPISYFIVFYDHFFTSMMLWEFIHVSVYISSSFPFISMWGHNTVCLVLEQWMKCWVNFGLGIPWLNLTWTLMYKLYKLDSFTTLFGRCTRKHHTIFKRRYTTQHSQDPSYLYQLLLSLSFWFSHSRGTVLFFLTSNERASLCVLLSS